MAFVITNNGRVPRICVLAKDAVDERSVIEFKIAVRSGAELHHRDFEGKSVVHYAPVELLEFLVDKGADINVQDYYGRTLMHYRLWSVNTIGAANERYYEAFVKLGGDSELVDYRGRTWYQMQRFDTTHLYLPRCIRSSTAPQSELVPDVRERPCVIPLRLGLTSLQFAYFWCHIETFENRLYDATRLNEHKKYINHVAHQGTLLDMIDYKLNSSAIEYEEKAKWQRYREYIVDTFGAQHAKYIPDCNDRKYLEKLTARDFEEVIQQKESDEEALRTLRKATAWFKGLLCNNDLLFVCVRRNFTNSFEHLIAYGWDIDRQDANGDTPLHVALRDGYMLNALHLFKDADVTITNNKNKTALEVGLPFMVAKFEEQSDHYAMCLRGEYDAAIEAMRENGILDTSGIFEWAMEHDGGRGMFEGLVKRYRGRDWELMLKAMERDDVISFKTLLRCGADVTAVDEKGYDLWYYAVQCQDIKQVLREQGLGRDSAVTLLVKGQGSIPIPSGDTTSAMDIVEEFESLSREEKVKMLQRLMQSL